MLGLERRVFQLQSYAIARLFNNAVRGTFGVALRRTVFGVTTTPFAAERTPE
jgi:hypothetical protein